MTPSSTDKINRKACSGYDVDVVTNGDDACPVPAYTDENVSTKVIKLIQSYVGVVDKMIWKKS